MVSIEPASTARCEVTGSDPRLESVDRGHCRSLSRETPIAHLSLFLDDGATGDRRRWPEIMHPLGKQPASSEDVHSDSISTVCGQSATTGFRRTTTITVEGYEVEFPVIPGPTTVRERGRLRDWRICDSLYRDGTAAFCATSIDSRI